MPSFAIELKEQLKAERQIVIDRFLGDGKTDLLLTDLTKIVDAALAKSWTNFDLPASAALVAVGGYGRGEMFPYSDVDVLILLQEAPDDAVQAKLEELIQLFWDIGLEIGHSIRTIDECLSESAADITVQTSLLEARLIIGNAPLFQSMKERCDAAMNPRAFFQAKTLELRQRHASTKTRLIALNRIARKVRAACAIYKSFYGLQKQPVWVTHGRHWPSAD